ncbi:MAG: SRPBCC domain-containing protein [Pseudomonadota bacterium]
MTTDTNHFTLTRDYPLPPEKMWHLMTDADMRSKWGAPEEGMILEVTANDLQVDGIEWHRCGPAENPEFEVETRWMRLDGPEHAVFTEMIQAGGARLGASLVTYRITADGSGSKVDIAVSASSFVGEGITEEIMQGWQGGIANLDKLVAEQAANY